MIIVLFYFGIVFGAVAGIMMTTITKNNDTIEKQRGYNPITSSLIETYTVKHNGQTIFDENGTVARNADTAAARVCRQLNYEMKKAYNSGDLTCVDYRKPTLLYSFIGTIGTAGSLDTIYTLPVSTTLSCVTPERYARYLFIRALPATIASGKNARFNLLAISDGRLDPCGFNEIIY